MIGANTSLPIRHPRTGGSRENVRVGRQIRRYREMKAGLIGSLGWLLVATASATGEPLLRFDDIRARAIAIEAIRAKYPEIPGSELSYAGWSVRATTNEPPKITIHYRLGKPKVELVEDDKKERVTRRTQTHITVKLSVDGEVQDVDKGSFTSTTN
jgi:hypothetical protein